MDVLKNKTAKTSKYFSRYNGKNYYMNTLDVLSKDTETGSVAYKEQLETSRWLSHNNDYKTYITKEGDTYDSIALQFYNNPTYYWIICDFNRVLDCMKPLKPDTVLYIPTLGTGFKYEEY